MPFILRVSPFLTVKLMPLNGTFCPLMEAVPLTIFPDKESDASVVVIQQEAETPKNKGFLKD